MTWRRLHRWLAIVLVVPLVVWSITGLLFHLKPGWARAYDQLDVEQADPPVQLRLAALAVALDGRDLCPAGSTAEGRCGSIDGHPIQHLDVFATALGPLARVTGGKTTELYDATTGARRSPLSEADARTLVIDAVSRSPHHADYGTAGAVTTTDDAIHVAFAHDIAVEIDRNDARISQRGADTARIDWLYRIHYLQWTGNQTIDRILAVVGLALIWAVVIPGLVLFVRGRSSRLRRDEPQG